MDWDLTKLYSGFDDNALTADLDFAENEAKSLSDIFKSAEPSEIGGKRLRELISRMSKLYERLTDADSFVFLTLAADGTNESALKLTDRCTRCEMAVRSLGSAFCSFAGKIPCIDTLIADEPSLGEFAFFLKESAESAKHVVDPVLEPTVLKLRMTGSGAFSRLRGMLDATHTVEIELDGEKQRIPLSAARNLAYSPDAETRKKGYEAEIASYPLIEQSMAACLNGIKGEALTVCELEKYESPLAKTLADSRMDAQTLDALLTAMKESLPDFRRYFKAKARALGHQNGLPFYDLFAPMGKSDASFTLDESRKYLIDALGVFSPHMTELINRAFDERWIDFFPKKGKNGGAFCASIHGKKMSYILANFGGSLSDVGTLAHELGHAFHNECLKNADILNASAPMPLAETASIFNETLMTNAALRDASPEEEIMLIDAELTDAAQVVVDILSRYLFETEVFARRPDHSLTVQELKEIMRDAQLRSYGDGLDPDALHPYMWACKGHYYRTETSFYNFPYAFGLLFGKGVYALYEEKGADFPPIYEELLRLTGSDTIYNVAKSVGIDVRDPDFWRTSVKKIVEQIDRFVELVDKN